MESPRTERPPFEIFRGSDAPNIADHSCMTYEGITPVVAEGIEAAEAAGSSNGVLTDVPYCRPEMSLARLRLKSGYPLPLHSHDCDCLYYVASGSLTIGTETLEAGDGFFVGRDVPYGYTAGPEGAVVIEFRSTDSFNMRFQARTEAAWNKVASQIEDAQDRWASEPLPAIG